MIRPGPRSLHAAGVQHLPGDEEDAVQVGVDHVVPELVRDLGGDASAAAPGVVDQDVDPAEVLHRGCDEVADVVGRGDVARGAVDVETVLAQLLDVCSTSSPVPRAR